MAFQANAFQNNAFQIDGSVAEVVSGGDLRTTRDDLRHALHFYNNFAPHAKRKAEEIVDRAAAAERLAEASKRSQDAEHVAQMGLLRAEFLAMAETREYAIRRGNCLPSWSRKNPSDRTRKPRSWRSCFPRFSDRLAAVPACAYKGVL